MSRDTKYGIKEVADVTFYKISGAVASFLDASNAAFSVESGVLKVTYGEVTASAIDSAFASEKAFTFDSLKVSNIEVASEDTYAQGGKGNPKLIGWSYGKEVTFTMEDALVSLDTLSLWLGGKEGETGNSVTITSNDFPDSYFIVGNTYMRPFGGGEDEVFYFVIPKGHVQVNGTVTMEAEGDPSTFEMTIDALAQKIQKDTVLVEFINAGVKA